MTKLTLPALYAIININEDNFREDMIGCNDSLLYQSLHNSLELLQIRCKDISTTKVESLVESICTFKKEANSKSLVILNDYVEIAHKYGLDGVHLGQSDKSPIDARAICGDDFIIGLSCHNIQDLESAPTDILNYIACGPIYSSATKNGHAPEVGILNLQKFCLRSALPVVAIGGITLKNAAPVFHAGAASCAVISELEKCHSPKALDDEFRLIKATS